MVISGYVALRSISTRIQGYMGSIKLQRFWINRNTPKPSTLDSKPKVKGL